MANWSIDSVVNTEKDSNGKTLIRAVLWADSVAHVPAYNALSATEDKIFDAGSVAIIPSAGKVLFLDFDHSWKEWGGA